MLRMLDAPNQPPEPGWIGVVTPLGASAHAAVNSPAHELCEDWNMLSTGRVQLIDRANFAHWFGPLFRTAPIGLVAELLFANSMSDPFAALLVAQPAALAHILALENHCFGMDHEEWLTLGAAMDIARRLQAGIAARAAAAEAMRDL